MNAVGTKSGTSVAGSSNLMNAGLSRSSDSISGSQQPHVDITDNLCLRSSLFALPAEDLNCAYDQSSKRSEPGDLIVDFPERDCDQYGYSHKHDYDEHDTDDRKPTEIRHGTHTPPDSEQLYESSSSNSPTDRGVRRSSLNTGPTRIGEAARMEQLAAQNMQGGKNYRPLVGGFAAAAYEAMKEHHYSDKTLDCDTSEVSDTK